MVILVKNERGSDVAVNLAKESWTAETLPGDESKIVLNLQMAPGLVIEKQEYDRIKSKLRDNEDIIDLTS